MKLIPVVEFEPFAFQTVERESPIDCSNDDPQSWDDYWRNSLADGGITNIEPYEMSSWFVEVSKLTPKIVEILLNITYKVQDKTATSLEEMELGSLSGGYVLQVSKTVQITPQCCGGLEDIEDWETASNWMNTEEMMLWIGHPWLMVSSVDDRHLQIRRTAEYGQPKEPVLITIDRNELKKAIIVAREQLDIFKQVLLVALPNAFSHLLNDSPSPTADEIAERLIF